MILKIGIKLEDNFKIKRKKVVYHQEICEYIYEDVDGTLKLDRSIHYQNTKITSGWNRWVNGKIYSNKREAALYSAHKQEYATEYKLKLRSKRSHRILASPWNEEPSSFMDKTKSWKDSTKRKKQYYKEK